MSDEATSKDKKSIIKAAKDCLDNYRSRNSDNIARAEDAIRFRALEQWPDQIKRDRESDKDGARPCPVLDKTNQYVRQIINEERQNRAAIKISPVDDNADKKVAEIYTGIIRHIEYASNAISAYTTAGEHAVDGGFGYFRVLTEYCDDMSFDQDIRIKRIPNRFSVAMGPHTEIDGSDAQEVVVWEDMPLATFKAQYPKAKLNGFTEIDGWMDDDSIRVAEYMVIKTTKQTIHMVQGQTLTDDELNEVKAEAKLAGVSIEPEKSRTSNVKKVHWHKLTAGEILEERELLGTFLPVIKVTGNELIMPDGKVRLSGAIESMMDPQRLHNYAHAGFIEHVALAPRAPWVAPLEAVAGNEQDYADANRRNISVLTYRHVDDNGAAIPAPQRTPPPGISPGWQQMLQNTEHGIESAIGMYGPSVGAKSQEKSGIALQEQKSQGMVGNFHFPDNLARSIQHCGRILLEWIPKVYDTKRVSRILGEDMEADMAYLNPDQEEAVMPRMDNMNQQIGESYNLNVGKYDVTVSTGPSYTSKRQEAATNQLQLIQAKPELMGLIGDIVFRNMDAPGSDKIADRLKAMLPPQIQQLEQNEEKGPVDPKVQAQMAQIQQMGEQIQQKGMEIQQAEQVLMQKAQEISTSEQEIQAESAKLDADKRVFMAEAKNMKLEIENQRLKAMADISAESMSGMVDMGHEMGEPAETTQAPQVNVIDSSVAAPLADVSNSVNAMTEIVGQTMANISQVMAQVAAGMQQSAEATEMMAIQQSRPKQARLSDGRVITLNTIQ